jgi:hypothetical protein
MCRITPRCALEALFALRLPKMDNDDEVTTSVQIGKRKDTL